MTTEKAIQLLNSKIRELTNVYSPDDFLSWRDSTVQRLQIICPNNPIIKQISELRPIARYNSDNLVPKITPQVKKMMDSLVEDIEVAGIEAYHKNDKKNESSTLIVQNTNTQSQSQEQRQDVTLNFEFVVACLKNGLRDTEIEELKDILAAQEDSKVKKKKFSDKLLSFGSDVASNILANILTNSQVYEQLSRML